MGWDLLMLILSYKVCIHQLSVYNQDCQIHNNLTEMQNTEISIFAAVQNMPIKFYSCNEIPPATQLMVAISNFHVFKFKIDDSN